jgi:hypothetical protein
LTMIELMVDWDWMPDLFDEDRTLSIG